ncbi:MAG: helix-turn-helix domain-containing protein [Solirubrobacteraceae bacterium]
MNNESSIDSDPHPEGRAPGGENDTSPASHDGGGSSGAQPGGGSVREPLVAITLSRNQVDHVMRAALGDEAAPNLSGLVAETGFHGSHARDMLNLRYRDLQSNRRLSRSLLAGLLVLSCFPPEGMDIGIKDISEQLELNTSTVHRYVLTLVAAGLLERDPDTRRYRLLPE